MLQARNTLRTTVEELIRETRKEEAAAGAEGKPHLLGVVLHEMERMHLRATELIFLLTVPERRGA